jgi:hypothetical protein
MNLALRSDQPRKTGRPLRGGLRLAFGALVAAGLIGAAVPWSASAAPPPGGIPTAAPTHHPVATSTPSTTTDPSATPLQLIATQLYANHTTGEVGKDEPYLVFFAADLSKPKGRGITPYTNYFEMNANGKNTVYPNVHLWSTDGGKAPMKDPNDVLVLAALMENDGGTIKLIRDSVDSDLQQVLADDHNLPYTSLVSKLRTKMDTSLQGALKGSGGNHDEQIGSTQSVSVTPGDVLDASNGVKVSLPKLRFIGHNANYELSFTLSR